MLRPELEELLKGKTIQLADLSRGTVRLTFTDGTRFEREKTFEGMITATLFDARGNTLAAIRI
jgi:hypothetical protein